MKTFSLNCLELGNLEIVSELHAVVRKEDPSIVFLMETWLELRNFEFLRVLLGMRGCFSVERYGYGGGLALLWNSNVAIQDRKSVV